MVVLQFPREGRTHEGARLQESGIFSLLRLLGRFGGERIFKVGIEISDQAADPYTPVVEPLPQVLGLGGIVDRDAIVVRVQRFDETFVELFPQNVHLFAALIQPRLQSYDWLAEVHVDQARRRQLGRARGECGREGALVVVVAVLGRVILAAHVDDGVTGREKSGVTGADEGRWIVGGEHAEKVHGECLIGVEVTTEDV